MRGEYRQGAIASNFLLELPPRARRILLVPVTPVDDFGTTSACAENTNCSVVAVLLSRNYLRVRGEYCAFTSVEPHGKELPPRARRIRGHDAVVGVQHGTTSACAENTFWLTSFGGDGWNYLRVRGEYILSTIKSSSFEELPPRARRIHNRIATRLYKIGTTSACAENTLQQQAQQGWIGNYLRVRGEYNQIHPTDILMMELPPRARRIHGVQHAYRAKVGTTSACAENTFPHPMLRFHSRNYLRVRGEYAAELLKLSTQKELPPRARRIRRYVHSDNILIRTTSACAENTRTTSPVGDCRWNYLRVRGEYTGN